MPRTLFTVLKQILFPASAATGRFNLAVDSSTDDGEIEIRISVGILNITELSHFLVDVYKCLQQKFPALFSQE
ncbi:unnamed protein product [Timema podura]|uniref:Uncharacterized protein n=1 Tax=Timema podura TaxID=61482 RepID=A0ABN7PCD0_TIMPD|nr:unnamed protein product [Timema podura]